MAAQTIVGLVGIVVLVGVVVAVVAVWRTGTPFPAASSSASVAALGPDCVTCGHEAHRGHCAVRVSASGDIYDGGGDWVGYRNETFCACRAYRTEPWPPCTVCGHGRNEHRALLRCRGVRNRGLGNEAPCPCDTYRAEPGPRPSSYETAVRAQDRRCPLGADGRPAALRCLPCALLGDRCPNDPS
ncbi:hypothetical protein ACIRBX_25810 [Kitasatospora sp. NPDC096147]|uniref:hypothetical protein n=1 Tax=Kitasatospora sp. NPDC096147 TaxID=3364093 RepID=UPI003819E772